MRLRHKLLLLLLAVGLLPLLVATLIGQASTRTLGSELGADVRAVLIERAESQLAESLRAAADVLTREANSVDHLCHLQSLTAREALFGPMPAERTIYFAREDFDLGRQTPPDLAPNDRYVEVLADGTRQTKSVSMEHQSILLAPGVSSEDPAVASQIRRLAAMTIAYRELNDPRLSLVYWQYTSTALGVHAKWPGHGGYPPSYDGRERLWYRQVAEAVKRGETDATWSPPITDATTGQVMLTVSAPVLDLNGQLAAVTAVDVRLVDILGEVSLPPEWQDQGEVLLAIVPDSQDPTADRRPRIIVQRDYQQAGLAWDTPIELEVLDLGDEQANARLVSALNSQEPVTLRGTRHGHEHVIAVQGVRLGEDTTTLFVAAVPIELLTEPANATEAGFQARTRVQLISNAILLSIVLVVVVIIAGRASSVVTRPIAALAETAARIRDGDLDARASLHTGDEIQELGDTFDHMIPALRERVRMKESLDLARQIQQRLLPSKPPVIPGFDVFGLSLSADETGGDTYDFLGPDELGEGLHALLVGDVTGHGVPAALLMASARARLRERLAESTDLKHAIGAVNKGLVQDASEGRFMTLLIFVIDLNAKQMTWLSAGHDPALVYDPHSGTISELTSNNGGDLPLGIEASWSFHVGTRTLPEPGEVFLLGTDGVWEARNSDDKMFGKDRLVKVMADAVPAGDAKSIALAVSDAVAAFRGQIPQHDDVTLVVFRGV
jgi:phosphoserine phosphatase RsbU/P